MYEYNLVVRKTGHSEWTVFSENGTLLFLMDRCAGTSDAMDRAKVWASTWSSVSIRIEDEKVS